MGIWGTVYIGTLTLAKTLTESSESWVKPAFPFLILTHAPWAPFHCSLAAPHTASEVEQPNAHQRPDTEHDFLSHKQTYQQWQMHAF